VELSQKLVENELLGREISLADVEKGQKQQQQQQYRRPVQQMDRKHSPISPSPPIEQYNTSSFEEDVNTESKISRSEDDDHGNIPRRKSPMEGTGRFTTAAFENRKLPRDQSSSSSSPAHSPVGIILKPTIIVKKPSSIHEENNQFSDRDADSLSTSSRSKGRLPQKQQPRQQSSDDDNDDDLLLSTKTGEKIYSTDFDESRSKHRNIGNNYDEDDDDIVDTMKLSARSLNAAQHSSYDTDED
jgi:hypothetical protein